MRQYTIQERFNLLQEGKIAESDVIRAARREFPNLIHNSFDIKQVEATLKNYHIINENYIDMKPLNNWESRPTESWEDNFKKFLKEEKSSSEEKSKLPKLDKEVEDAAVRGWKFRDKSQFGNLSWNEYYDGMDVEYQLNPSEEDFSKLSDKVMKNLAKDPLHYKKTAQFNVPGIEGLQDVEQEEAKGKHKASGYGDLDKEAKARINESLDLNENESEEEFKIPVKKIEKLVATANELIEKAFDSDGDPIGIVDTSGTWEEPEYYSPIHFDGKNLTIISKSYSGKESTEEMEGDNLYFDGIPTLQYIIRNYKKALKKHNIQENDFDSDSKDDNIEEGRKKKSKSKPAYVHPFTGWLLARPYYSYAEDKDKDDDHASDGYTNVAGDYSGGLEEGEKFKNEEDRVRYKNTGKISVKLSKNWDHDNKKYTLYVASPSGKTLSISDDKVKTFDKDQKLLWNKLRIETDKYIQGVKKLYDLTKQEMEMLVKMNGDIEERFIPHVELHENKNMNIQQKLKEIEKGSIAAACKHKIDALQEAIDDLQSKVNTISENEGLSEFVDKKQVKLMEKDISQLSKAKLKLEAQYKKLTGGKVQKPIVDKNADGHDDRPVDNLIDESDYAYDDERYWEEKDDAAYGAAFDAMDDEELETDFNDDDEYDEDKWADENEYKAGEHDYKNYPVNESLDKDDLIDQLSNIRYPEMEDVNKFNNLDKLSEKAISKLFEAYFPEKAQMLRG